jgi:membrane protease subunit HflK
MSSGLVTSGVVIAALVWASFGFYRVDAAERGLEFRFGAFQGLTDPGLQWHWPWPIERAEKINTGATEPFNYSASMLTQDENIVNVALVVQFRRADAEHYVFKLDDPMETLEAATASAIREVIGRSLLEFILTEGRTEISVQTQRLLQETLDLYEAGITIYQVNLVEAEFPPEVGEAMQDSIRAREDRERRILEAQTYSNDILPRARGEAERRRQEAEAYQQQVIADAEGEADRFTQVLAEYQKAPGVTRERMYIETLEEILSSSTKVLVDTEGGNNLLYLPLDQLVQRRPAPVAIEPPPVTAAPPTPNATTPRSRDRDGGR